jgi:hypothetical protein
VIATFSHPRTVRSSAATLSLGATAGPGYGLGAESGIAVVSAPEIVPEGIDPLARVQGSQRVDPALRVREASSVQAHDLHQDSAPVSSPVTWSLWVTFPDGGSEAISTAAPANTCALMLVDLAGGTRLCWPSGGPEGPYGKKLKARPEYGPVPTGGLQSSTRDQSGSRLIAPAASTDKTMPHPTWETADERRRETTLQIIWHNK